MIQKKIVEQIIHMNDQLHVGEPVQKVIKSHAGDGIEKIAKGYSIEKQALVNYIANLSFCDIIDLGGLMGYGRELHQKEEHSNVESFHSIKTNFLAAHEKGDNEQGKKHLAIYFVEKGKMLSEYLRKVLFML